MDSLLTNIHDTIEASSTLSYIIQTEIVQSLNVNALLSILHETPVCFIYPISSAFVPVSLAEACEDHVYEIGVAVLQDNFQEDNYAFIGTSDGALKGIAEIEADIRSVLNRTTFSIDQLEAYYEGASYAGLSLPDRGLAQVSCRMRYEYTDIS